MFNLFEILLNWTFKSIGNFKFSLDISAIFQNLRNLWSCDLKRDDYKSSTGYITDTHISESFIKEPVVYS